MATDTVSSDPVEPNAEVASGGSETQALPVKRSGVRALQTRSSSWLGGGSLVWLCSLAACLPLMGVFVYRSVGEPSKAFVPIAILATLFLLWWRRGDGPPRVGRTRQIACVALAVFGVALSVVLASPYPAAAAMVAILIVGLGRTADADGYPWSLSALGALGWLSLPGELHRVLIGAVGRFAASWSSVMLDRMQIPHWIRAGEIRMPEMDVSIGELMTPWMSAPFLIAIAFWWMAYGRMHWILAPLYAIAGVVTAIGIQTLRGVFAIWVAVSAEMDPTSGWLYWTLTILSLVLAVGMLYSFHWLIRFLFHPILYSDESGTNPLVELWNRFCGDVDESGRITPLPVREPTATVVHQSGWLPKVAIGVCAVALVGAVFAVPSVANQSEEPIAMLDDILLANPPALIVDEATYPVGPPATKRSGKDQISLWAGRSGTASVRLQLNQTFPSWREVSRGYELSGWQILDRKLIEFSREDDASTLAENLSAAFDPEVGLPQAERSNEYVYVRMRKPGEFPVEGYLLSCGLTNGGSLVSPPRNGDLWVEQIKRRLGYGATTTPTAIFQMAVESEVALEPPQVDEMRSEFEAYCQQLSSAMSGD